MATLAFSALRSGHTRRGLPTPSGGGVVAGGPRGGGGGGGGDAGPARAGRGHASRGDKASTATGSSSSSNAGQRGRGGRRVGGGTGGAAAAEVSVATPAPRRVARRAGDGASEPRCTDALRVALGLPAVNESDPYQCQAAAAVLIHIPKTGGTSLEHAAKASPRRLLWGFQYERARFRKLRRGLPRVDADVPACVGGWGRRCCSWWHIPPSRVRDWRPYFMAPVRFCAVRNPYSRVLSEYSFSHGKGVRKLRCDELNRTDVNAWLRRQMALYESGRAALNDCHWIPQHVYVVPGLGVGAPSRVGETVGAGGRAGAASSAGAVGNAGGADDDGQSCNRVIRMENLTTSFNALMDEVGMGDVRLSKRRKSFTSRCKDVAMLDDETRGVIRRLYRRDFEQFGYAM